MNIGKEKRVLFLFNDNMIFYVENLYIYFRKDRRLLYKINDS